MQLNPPPSFDIDYLGVILSLQMSSKIGWSSQRTMANSLPTSQLVDTSKMVCVYSWSLLSDYAALWLVHMTDGWVGALNVETTSYVLRWSFYADVSMRLVVMKENSFYDNHVMACNVMADTIKTEGYDAVPMNTSTVYPLSYHSRSITA